MAKSDRTTAPALPASNTARVDTPSRGVESEPVASETAAPVRTSLADGSEYLVRPVKHDEPVVTMSNRHRRELEASKGTAAPAPRSTVDAGTASVNPSEAKANG